MHDKIANKKKAWLSKFNKGREGLNLSLQPGESRKLKEGIIITNNSNKHPVFININNPDLKKGVV